MPTRVLPTRRARCAPGRRWCNRSFRRPWERSRPVAQVGREYHVPAFTSASMEARSAALPARVEYSTPAAAARGPRERRPAGHDDIRLGLHLDLLDAIATRTWCRRASARAAAAAPPPPAAPPPTRPVAVAQRRAPGMDALGQRGVERLHVSPLREVANWPVSVAFSASGGKFRSRVPCRRPGGPEPRANQR